MNDKTRAVPEPDPRDTSQPGREEEVIEQASDLLEKGFKEGLADNDNAEEVETSEKSANKSNQHT